MDTWATSSLTPQIAGRYLADPDLYAKVFPMSLRPQAHEIIRTWAFYTIVKSFYHWSAVPWRSIAISGWALAPGGTGKISKSRGGGPTTPMAMIERYSADAVRYWAASTGFGRDALISEEKVQAGARLVTKLWSIGAFCRRFLADYTPPESDALPDGFSPADLWVLARLQRLIRDTTEAFKSYNYSSAKSDVEDFLWNDFADNYLEMAKFRLYGEEGATRTAARYALHRVLTALVKLLAPILPHVTEAVYREVLAGTDRAGSLHRLSWPVADQGLISEEAETNGVLLVRIAGAVRRFKTGLNLSPGAPLALLELAADSTRQAALLEAARADLLSITRAARVAVVSGLDPNIVHLPDDGSPAIGLALPPAGSPS